MKAIIKKSVLKGEVIIPTSKSIAHRMLINASMCKEPVSIYSLPKNQDIFATIDCLKALGNEIIIEKNRCTVFPKKSYSKKRVLNCNESGSTLRFLIPIALLDNVETTFIGTERLFQRPLNVYEEIAEKNGFLFKKTKNSLTVKGQLQKGEYFVKGNVSSQFISGLLFALSDIKGESKIVISTETESEPYIDLTIDLLKKFGIKTEKQNNIISVCGGERIIPKEITVEGDCSAGAFFGVMNYLGGDVKLLNMPENTLQGDSAWQNIFPQFKKNAPIISVKNCPDLAPILLALGAAKNGCTLLDTRRLKDKECDRGFGMKTELEKFGVIVTVNENSIVVKKGKIHPPAVPLYSHNDHRIVMALAVLSAFFGEENNGTEIDGAEAVNKSFPEFFEVLESIGASVKII